MWFGIEFQFQATGASHWYQQQQRQGSQRIIYSLAQVIAPKINSLGSREFSFGEGGRIYGNI